MQVFFKILLVFHVAVGAIALVSGLVAIVAKKGFKTHRAAGKIYFVSMLAVAISATILATIKYKPFLLHIGIFSFFMTFMGKKMVSPNPLKPRWTIITILVVAAVNSLLMLASLNLVLMVFGGINAMLTVSATRLFASLMQNKQVSRTLLLSRHISMMVGSYIATTTAFLVNVQTFQPQWIGWLGPTIVGTPLIIYWITKTKRKAAQKAVAVLIIICAGIINTEAQPYVEGGNTRHRFAQMTIGVDVRTYTGGTQSARLDNNGNIEKFKLNTHSEGRLLIGGTHFWGHADFYIAISVASVGGKGFFTSVETGAKLYPWRIKHKKLRPFVGASLLPVLFQQGNGATVLRNTVPVQAGITYAYKKHLIEFGAGYNYSNKLNYYISPSVPTTITTPPFWFSVGYKFMFETSLSAEKDWESGYTKKLTDTLAKLGRLDGFTFAIGPSAAFFLKNSTHNASAAPAADNHKTSLLADVGVGYYLHKPDVQVNLAFRSYKSTIDAYGFSQTVRRTSLALEAYKFWFDYHGFAMFAGPALSYEWLTVNETNAQAAYKGIKPGLTFGWDIRPNRLQAFYLRTNLRWFPNLSVAMPDGKKVFFNALEFNFIQLVVFPDRLF